MPHCKPKQHEIYYEQHGQGPDLILVSGFGGTHQIWEPLYPYLTSHFTLTVFDNRDSGKSGYATQDYSIKDMAQDVIDLMGHLHIERAHIIGHSMGGNITEMVLADHSHHIDKAILSCNSAYTSGTKRLHYQLQEELQSTVDPQMALKNGMCFYLGESFLKDEKQVNRWVDLMLQSPYPQSPQARLRQKRALFQHQIPVKLKQYNKPVLVIGCEEDILAPPQHHAATYHQLLPNSQMKIIKQSGHIPQIEQPKPFAKMITDFLLSEIC